MACAQDTPRGPAGAPSSWELPEAEAPTASHRRHNSGSPAVQAPGARWPAMRPRQSSPLRGLIRRCPRPARIRHFGGGDRRRRASSRRRRADRAGSVWRGSPADGEPVQKGHGRRRHGSAGAADPEQPAREPATGERRGAIRPRLATRLPPCGHEAPRVPTHCEVGPRVTICCPSAGTRRQARDAPPRRARPPLSAGPRAPGRAQQPHGDVGQVVLEGADGVRAGHQHDCSRRGEHGDLVSRRGELL